MHPLLFVTLMSLPIYPLNPIEQDTIDYMNLHITAGINGPNSTVTSGPEATIKYELVIHHPFILRTAIDYRFGKVSTNVFPEGNLHRGIISAEAIYYRGTDKSTGYLGLGVVFSMNLFQISDKAKDSLYKNNGVTNTDVSNVFGYRITAGLRIHKSYSIEVGITEVRPKFIFTKQHSPTRFTVYKEKFRYNDFRITFGYLFSLKI